MPRAGWRCPRASSSRVNSRRSGHRDGGKSMLKKTAKGLVAVALGMSMFAGTALADSGVSNIHKMKFQKGGTATLSWQAVPEDSPNDVNSKALIVNVPNDGGSYGVAYTAKSVNINKNVGNVHNLSF